MGIKIEYKESVIKWFDARLSIRDPNGCFYPDIPKIW
jgi:hypothetical protein